MATIRIKRSTGSTAPETLANAELAYAEGSDKLYIGYGTGVTAGIRQIASGTLFNVQTESHVYAAPGNANGVPSFRILTLDDISGLNDALDEKAALASPALTGAPTAPTQPSSDNSTKIATTAFVRSLNYSTTVGTVTSVGLTLPDIFNTGAAVTTSGNLTATLASQTGGLVFASPAVTGGTPTFRALAKTDLPSFTAYVDDSNNFIVGTTQTFSGTVNLANAIQIGGVAMTSSAAELNYLKNASVGTVVNSKAVIYSASGEVIGSSFATSGVRFSSAGIVTVGEDALPILDIANYALCNGTTGLPELTFGTPGEVGVSGDLNVGGDAAVTGSLTVTGNLIINGTTTTVNSTQITLDDPVLTLGGDTAPTVDSNTDRGIEFRWHDGTQARLGFFGMDDSTGRFSYRPVATASTSHVYDGSLGPIDASEYYVNGTQLSVANLNNTTTGTGSIVLATNPALTGVPTAPTAAADTNTTQIATAAFVLGQAATATPLVNGTAAAGAATRFSRAAHVHPIDTTRAPLASPTFTGSPAAPTPTTSDNSTKIATTAFVKAQGYALESSLGTMAGQDASAVAITGGSISGVTIDGGTF